MYSIFYTIQSIGTVLTLIGVIGTAVHAMPLKAISTDLNSVVEQIGRPQFEGLRFLINEAGWPVPDAEDTYVNAAVVALENLCVNDMLKVWLVRNEEIKSKFELWFRNRCDEIMPTFKQHKKYLQQVAQEDNDSKVTDLYRMGLACRALFNEKTKEEIREQFISNVFKHNRRLIAKFGDRKAFGGISTGDFMEMYRLERMERAERQQLLSARLREEKEKRESDMQAEADARIEDRWDWKLHVGTAQHILDNIPVQTQTT